MTSFACVCGPPPAGDAPFLPRFLVLATISSVIDRTGGRGAAPPVVVFLCLLLLLAGIGGVVIWTGQTDAEPIPPAPIPSASPDGTTDMTLTDEEAIARFKELDAARVSLFEKRNLHGLSRIFTTDSPARRRLERSIRSLVRDQAFADVRSETLRRSVVENTYVEVVVEEVVLFDIRFKDAAGQDITQSGGVERQRVRWTLRREADEWLIHNALVMAARPVTRR